MGLNIAAPFKRQGAFPIDEDFVKSKAEMLIVDDNTMPDAYLCVCKDDGKLYLYDKTNTSDPETGKYRVFESGGGVVDVELTKAQYDALSEAEKMNGTNYFITDWNAGGSGSGGGGDQWIVLSKDLVISANELRAIENSKKPIMWFDGNYYTPITNMDVNTEWGNGYVTYYYNNYKYSIYFSYDGDDWDQPVTWGAPYASQSGASLSLVNQNGGVRVSQNISGQNASMWLYPEWNIPNFVNSRLEMHGTTKSHDLMTRYAQPQNIVKTGRVFVDIEQTGTGGSAVIDISDLNFASTDDYMVMTSLEQSAGTDTAICTLSHRQPDSFRVSAHKLSSGGLAADFYVNYMVLANKYYELFSSSTNIINSEVSSDKYTWARITTDKSSYSDLSVLKNGYYSTKLRVYAPNSSVPFLALYDTEGTETQDAEHFYYPIKWVNVDGTAGTPFDNFVYLTRSRRGGVDNDLWLASAPSLDRLDTYLCPAINKVTIVREK